VHQYLPFIIIGITTGSAYGLAATGLVLTYKTSGIFNFAHGSVATLAVYVMYWLRDQHGVPWPIAAAVAVFALGPLLGLLLEYMARILASASSVLKIAATIGIVIIVLAIGDIWYGSNTGSFPSYLPTSTIRVAGVNVGWSEITVTLIALASAGGLYYFFRFVRLGAAMRGVVDDPGLIAMTGVKPAVVRRWAWIIGSTFAALSGVLIAPSLSLNALVLTELVVQAFGAAAIGYFSSLPLTYLGGLVVGVAGAVSTKFVTSVPSLSGLPAGLPFIILFLVLVITPRARLAAKRYVPSIRFPEPYRAPARIRCGTGLIAVAALAIVPLVVGTKLAVFSSALVLVIIFISLGLLVRVSGQVSLCQYAFAAVGAAAMGHFAHNLGIPWLLALFLASAIAVPIGAIIAIPAIRLSGVFLALATLGFGVLLEQMFYSMAFMFGPTTSGIAVPRPDFSIGSLHFGTDTGFYYVILLFTVLSAVAMVMIIRSRLGRVLSAMSDSPLALETLGATVNVARVLIFCISAFMAAMAGALSASLFSFAVGSDFPSFSSLTLVALIAIIPLGAPWYALVAAASLAVIPAYIDLGRINDYLQIIFGLSAVLAPVTLARYSGAPRVIRRLADRIDSVIPRRERQTRVAGAVAHGVRGEGLEIDLLSVAYGGALAVSDLSLTAPSGRITGLIGPNGAGKTTTFNAACGLIRPSHGQIRLHGSDVSARGPAARARRGLGRTFQRVELFDSLTVRENVELGREAALAGANPFHHLAASRGDRVLVATAAEEAIDLVGVASIADVPVGDLSTGQKRLVELARVLSGPFDMILLDEPSSGLDANETQHFGRILIAVVASRRLGVLIVEHDMALVRQVCDQVWVLDFGRLIFRGSTMEMLESDLVRAAYLGSEDVSEDSSNGDGRSMSRSSDEAKAEMTDL
jgi:ABC-type branched-subunit amino acid transport system ATPase component/branched-subunit amino acid ABC-type transport system permease component